MKKLRIAIGALTLSAAGLVGLAVEEGYTDKAVIPVKGDVPTMGFGSTTHDDGRPVQMSDTTTPVKALKRTLAYTQTAEVEFKRCVHVPLTQGEFDVYLNFGYQYGMPTLCSSSMVKNLNAYRYVEACDALLLYRKVAGFDCSTQGNTRCMGVWTRQKERHAKCMAEQQ